MLPSIKKPPASSIWHISNSLGHLSSELWLCTVYFLSFLLTGKPFYRLLHKVTNSHVNLVGRKKIFYAVLFLSVPEFIEPVFVKTSLKKWWKRAFWACFRENWFYKFGHCSIIKRYWLYVLILRSCVTRWMFFKVLTIETVLFEWVLILFTILAVFLWRTHKIKFLFPSLWNHLLL